MISLNPCTETITHNVMNLETQPLEAIGFRWCYECGISTITVALEGEGKGLELFFSAACEYTRSFPVNKENGLHQNLCSYSQLSLGPLRMKNKCV